MLKTITRFLKLPWSRGPEAQVPGAKPPVTIPPERLALWQRIQAFPVDDPTAVRPLSVKLTEQQGWSHDFALDAMEEYKRFLFLCMVADHIMSPSHVVDEVWHLHLQYTESYVEDLCIGTLGRFLHHMPSKGGTAEGKSLHDLYHRSLETYRKFFGEPPDLFWGPHNGRLVRRFGGSVAKLGKELNPDDHQKGDRRSLLNVLKDQ